MIKLLSGFPDSVIACEARERVTHADYQDVLIPAVEKCLARHERLRLMYCLGPDFKRFTTTALWDDLRVGFHHLHQFERVAVVTDVDWLRRLAETANAALPPDIRVFRMAAFDDAGDWIRAGLD